MRVTGIRPIAARWLLALFVAAVVAGALVGGPGASLGDRDHAAVVAAMRDDSDYYRLIGGIVPAGAFAGRLIPPPTLALIESAMGPLGATILLCGVLAGILLVGWDRLTELFADASGRLLGAAMLLGGTTVGALLAIVEPHGGWAALLAAWSLLLRRRGRWVEAAAIACAAGTIEPGATLLAIVMAGTAWIDGERREAIGWSAAAPVAAACWLAHRVALAGLGIGSIGEGAAPAPFDVAAAALLPGAPAWLGGALLITGIAGWSVVRGDLARRVSALVLAGLLLAHAPGMLWAAVLTTPLLPLGLIFAASAAITLVRAEGTRRRITVTRVRQAERSDA